MVCLHGREARSRLGTYWFPMISDLCNYNYMDVIIWMNHMEILYFTVAIALPLSHMRFVFLTAKSIYTVGLRWLQVTNVTGLPG